MLTEISTDKRNIKWKLSDLTLQRFIEQCGDEAYSFFDAVDFFSRYAVFGEYGAYILSRAHKGTESLFRFKHEYFAQALNDYIVIDLLKAMEDKLWCKITQTSPIYGDKHSLICFPLQIRTSQTNGRQYLTFYAPHNHSYSSIRLDLITALEFIENIKMNGEDISLSSLQIKEEIENAIIGIHYSWGVSTTYEQENNAKKPVPLKEVRLVIRFDPETEYYILNRLEHEKRHGTIIVQDDRILFTIKVTDPTEMRPWLRSLYSRIVEYSGIDTDDFNLIDDVNEFKIIDNNFSKLKADTTYKTKWYIPEGTTYSIVKKSNSEFLFNPYFSVYFMLFGDILSSLYRTGSLRSDCLSKAEIQECIESCYRKRMHEIGSSTIKVFEDPNSKYNIHSDLKELNFVKCGHMDHGEWVEGNPKDKTYYSYHTKYRVVSKMLIDLFYKVIPLTAWELRWLCTILHDDKMQLFLSSDTINTLLSLIPENIKPIPLSDIIIFDQYHSMCHKPNIEVFNAIVSSLHKCVRLQIKYTDGKGRKYE